MTVYYWDSDSSIKEIMVDHAQKYPTAYIVASDKAPPSVYAKLPSLLKAQGMQTFADMHDGRPVLRVRDFQSDDRLINALKQNGILTTEPKKTEHDAPHKHAHGVDGLRQWVSANSMAASGISYLLADALAFGSGFVRKDLNGRRDTAAMMQGALWGASSLMLALYGTRDPKRQMDNLYHEIEEHFKENGIMMSDQEKHALKMLKGNSERFYDRIVNFIYQHPVEINNNIQALGGLMLAQAGLNQKTRNWKADPLIPSKKPNYLKIAAGLGVSIGMWGGMLVSEDQEVSLSEKEKEQRFLDRLEGKEVADPRQVTFLEDPVGWVKQKPLRLSGYGAMSNNILVFISAWFMEPHNVNRYFNTVQAPLATQVEQDISTAMAAKDVEATEKAFARKNAFKALENEQKNRRLGVAFDKGTPFPNLIANYLYSISPKDRRGTLKEDGYLDELYTMAANVFAHMPDDTLHKRVTQFATFMASHEEMKSTPDEIESAVLAKVANLKQNPWLMEEQDKGGEAHSVPENATDHIIHVDKGVSLPGMVLQPTA